MIGRNAKESWSTASWKSASPACGGRPAPSDSASPIWRSSEIGV